MNGPVRLADRNCRTLEGELVRHARAERPSADDFARLTAALGLGSSTAAATTSTTAATGAGGSVLSKSATTVSTASPSTMALLSAVAIRWLLVGGAVGVVAIGTTASIRFAWRTPATVIGQPVGASPNNRGQAAGAAQLRGSGQPFPDPINTGSAESASGAVGKLPAQPVLASLTPEIELLDRARTLVETHQPGAALSVLDSYDARFPTGTLVPEATVIRIRALLRSGRRRRAMELGTRFLAADPASPHAHQIRQLLSKAPTSTP